MHKILKTNFHNNPNLGLYGFTTDSYCLLPPILPKKLVEKIKNVLKVPIYQITIFHSNLLGVFCTGNDDLLLLPNIIFKHELEKIEKSKLNYKIINTKLTALGNNLLIKDNVCLINPNFPLEEREQLKSFKIITGKIANTSTVGSCIVLTKKGCLVHRDASETEIRKLENLFRLKTNIGTVNMGNPYVRSGIIANSQGYIIGKDTTGAEIMRIDSTLYL